MLNKNSWHWLFFDGCAASIDLFFVKFWHSLWNLCVALGESFDNENFDFTMENSNEQHIVNCKTSYFDEGEFTRPLACSELTESRGLKEFGQSSDSAVHASIEASNEAAVGAVPCMIGINREMMDSDCDETGGFPQPPTYFDYCQESSFWS